MMTQRVPSASIHRPHQRRALLGSILTYAVLVFWSLVCLFPLYWIAVTSLKGDLEIMQGPFYLPFVDFTPSLKAWVTDFTYANDHLLLRFFNSAVVAITSTLLTVLFGGMAVYGLTRFRYAVRWIPALNNNGILFAILATRILPPVAVVLPIYMMALFTGALDTHFALIFTYAAANLPVAVWLLLPVFGNRATSQEEAAQLDGASHLRIFLTIFLPMVAASTAAVGLLVFVLCWNEYIFASFLTSDKVSTLPAWIAGQMSIKEAQVGGDGDEWPQLSAAIVFMIVPLIACAAFTQRVLGRMALRNR
jgi:multiple sugar transport system permease protein